MIYSSIGKKPSTTVNKPEKRRESLPEIHQNSQNTSNSSVKLNTEFNREEKNKYSLLVNSCRVDNILSQTNNLNLKAVSAESLRSISPGSDSVFYSDPSNRLSSSPKCSRCNNEVNANFTNDVDSETVDIVKPPKGFGDSPEEPPTGSMKKSTKRYRSEERKRTVRSEHTRAKSEERVNSYKEKGR